MSLAALGITAAGALGQYALNQRSQKKPFNKMSISGNKNSTKQINTIVQYNK